MTTIDVKLQAKVASPTEAEAKKRWWRRWGEETFSAYLFLLPSIVIFAVFTFFPAIFSVVVSFFKWNMPAKAVFTGFGNYTLLFTDAIESPLFWRSVLNTFYFALGVPINLFVSLMIALLLNRKIRGVGIFRTAFFLPTIASVTAVSVVWLWFFHPADYGLFNSFLICPRASHPALACVIRFWQCRVLSSWGSGRVWATTSSFSWRGFKPFRRPIMKPPRSMARTSQPYSGISPGRCWVRPFFMF